MQFDPNTLVALVAVINALANAAALIINAIAHAQRPRTVSAAESFPNQSAISDSPPSFPRVVPPA